MHIPAAHQLNSTPASAAAQCSQPARQFTSIVLRFNRNTRLRFRPKIDHETAALRPSVDSPPLASTRVQRGRRRGPAAASMKLSRFCSTVRQRCRLVAQSLSAVCCAKPAQLGFNENARENDDRVLLGQLSLASIRGRLIEYQLRLG